MRWRFENNISNSCNCSLQTFTGLSGRGQKSRDCRRPFTTRPNFEGKRRDLKTAACLIELPSAAVTAAWAAAAGNEDTCTAGEADALAAPVAAAAQSAASDGAAGLNGAVTAPEEALLHRTVLTKASSSGKETNTHGTLFSVAAVAYTIARAVTTKASEQRLAADAAYTKKGRGLKLPHKCSHCYQHTPTFALLLQRQTA